MDVGELGSVANVVRFELGDECGGIHEFRHIAEAILWVQRQIEEWKANFGHIIDSNHQSPIGVPLDGWKEQLDDLTSYSNISDSEQLIISNSWGKLVTIESDIGQALRRAAEVLSAESFTGAAMSLGWRGPLPWHSAPHVMGLVFLDRALSRMRETRGIGELAKVHTEITSATGRISQLVQDTTEAQSDLSKLARAISERGEMLHAEIEARHATTATQIALADSQVATMQSTVAVIESSVAEMQSTVAQIASETAVKTEQTLADGTAKIEAWVSAQMEQTRLEAPVKLWSDRAKEHKSSSSFARLSAIIIGIAGLVGAIGVVIGGFKLAKWLFSEAITGSNIVVTRPILSLPPTFHFELTFALAATLLWLTMYIWTMRVIIRRYLSELHLATDANGRAAMTQVYLGLIKEGAATDAERAIVMGALFQPMNGGSLNDDGPPSMSLAAMMAAVASGKTPMP